MRPTVTLDYQLLAKAEQLCGHLERSALLKEALGALVQRESARRLAIRAPCQNRIPSLQLGKPWPQFKSVLRTEAGLGRVALPIQVATSAEKACKLFKP